MTGSLTTGCEGQSRTFWPGGWDGGRHLDHFGEGSVPGDHGLF